MVFITIVGLLVSTMLLSSQHKIRNSYRTQMYENSVAGARATIKLMSADIVFVMKNRPPILGGNMGNINQIIKSTNPPSISGY